MALADLVKNAQCLMKYLKTPAAIPNGRGRTPVGTKREIKGKKANKMKAFLQNLLTKMCKGQAQT